jgi:hypothetical protein
MRGSGPSGQSISGVPAETERIAHKKHLRVRLSALCQLRDAASCVPSAPPASWTSSPGAGHRQDGFVVGRERTCRDVLQMPTFPDSFGSAVPGMWPTG